MSLICFYPCFRRLLRIKSRDPAEITEWLPCFCWGLAAHPTNAENYPRSV